MKRINAKIVYYDGDGGGLGAHIRHLGHLEYLKLRYGINIYSVYPNLDVCFDHNYESYHLRGNERLVLIGDLFNDNETLTDDIISKKFNYCVQNNIVILSGKHHGPLPWENLPRLQWIKRKN